MNIFVTNLSFKVQTEQLREMFEAYGEVTSAKVIVDHETGRSRGFGFVEMSSDEQAQEAINALNQRDIDGKAMVVQQARPREEMQASKQNRGGNQGSYNKPYNENKSYNKSYNNNYGNNNGGGYKKRYDHDNEY
jgi:RNA recognition motif-containing protein